MTTLAVLLAALSTACERKPAQQKLDKPAQQKLDKPARQASPESPQVGSLEQPDSAPKICLPPPTFK
jgi:hypothetical protein